MARAGFLTQPQHEQVIRLALDRKALIALREEPHIRVIVLDFKPA
jgi:hypothetical protein